MGVCNTICWRYKISTRSQIAIEDADGTVRSVYCHHDGYIKGVGAILVKCYNDRKRIEELLALGSLSSVGEQLTQIPNELIATLLNIPHPSGCVAYHRDRGEDYCAPKTWKSADEMVEYVLKNYVGDFVYLFRNGNWYVKSRQKTTEWVSVMNLLQE